MEFRYFSPEAKVLLLLLAIPLSFVAIAIVDGFGASFWLDIWAKVVLLILQLYVGFDRFLTLLAFNFGTKI